MPEVPLSIVIVTVEPGATLVPALGVWPITCPGAVHCAVCSMRDAVVAATAVPAGGDMVGVMGKRWDKPDYLAGLPEAEDGPELIRFWRSPVFGEKFCDVPAFLLPRLTTMATEVAAAFPGPHTGLRVYYERAHCLILLAGVVRRTDPASFRLDEPPTNAERDLGRALGQAFHQGCSLADIALATGLPPDRVVAIAKRTVRGTGWLGRIADPDLA